MTKTRLELGSPDIIHHLINYPLSRADAQGHAFDCSMFKQREHTRPTSQARNKARDFWVPSLLCYVANTEPAISKEHASFPSWRLVHREDKSSLLLTRHSLTQVVLVCTAIPKAVNASTASHPQKDKHEGVCYKKQTKKILNKSMCK